MELLGAYSNQDTLLKKLQSLLEIQPSRSPDQDIRPPKQIQNRLSPGQQAELLERYLAGERAHLLARAFEINRTTLDRLLTSNGVRRPRSMTQSELTEAIQLYEQGWSCQRIGDRLGRDHSTIWMALKAAGVQLRRPWDANANGLS